MRKLFALLLTLMLATPGMAEGLDLTAYDDSMLVALLAQVQEEIVARRIEKTAILPAGRYIGGRDLPVGWYVLASDGTAEDNGIVALYTAEDENGDYEDKLYDFRDGDEVYSVYIYIDAGDELRLPFTHTLTISAGIVFR